MSCIHIRKGGRFIHVFIIFILPSLNRICTLYTLEEAKRLSLVKMSATDRNSFVPLDRDLEYTIEGASDIDTNISAIHTGVNAIIPSSMSYF